MIPRGGEGLKAALKDVATVPVIYAAAGNCHVYVHSAAQGLPAQHHGMVNDWNDDPLTGPAWTAARHLWKHADFTAQDVELLITDILGFTKVFPFTRSVR